MIHYVNIPLMKRRLNALLALLFILSTLVTGLHEMLPHHDSSHCQVCTVSEHSSALLPEAVTLQAVDVPAFTPIQSLKNQHFYCYSPTSGSRAPPFFS